MRETKFKAWDKKDKKMIDFNELGIDYYILRIWQNGWDIEFNNSEDPPKYYDNRRFVLIQFTGLHDKNGKEIYEGNIVKGKFPILINGPECKHICMELIGIIKYEDFCGSFIVDLQTPSGYWTSNNSLYRFVRACVNLEVIGNVWENPELLEGR